MPDIVLECRNVSKRFGKQCVLHDVNLKIARGQIVSLVGPSGCGKSTLLRAILGTHPPDDGEVLMNGVPVRGPGRDRGIVYQRYGLYPFLTARQNVAFGPMLDETNLPYRFFQFPWWMKLRRQHLAGADKMLERVRMGQAVHRYPEELSGGMCQRVAIAQALMMKPEILLLDEPFGALDEATREEMQEMLLELYAENLAAKRAGRKPPYTILIITHELNEAIYVADRVVGLSQHWRWEDLGGKAHPGATILYDAVSPVFSKNAEEEAAAFVRQRDEMRRVIFEPTERFSPASYARFWKQYEQGEAVGVMSKEFKS